MPRGADCEIVLSWARHTPEGLWGCTAQFSKFSNFALFVGHKTLKNMIDTTPLAIFIALKCISLRPTFGIVNDSPTKVIVSNFVTL